MRPTVVVTGPPPLAILTNVARTYTCGATAQLADWTYSHLIRYLERNQVAISTMAG